MKFEDFENEFGLRRFFKMIKLNCKELSKLTPLGP